MALALSQTVWAGDAPAPTAVCQAPLLPGDGPYVIRDLKMSRDPTNGKIVVTGCLATNDKRAIADTSIFVSVFRETGAFVQAFAIGTRV